ncbi:hypothetical protein [Clostridium folliculivorans]|uniref:Uncharacterized protein n=1 Tax=Clostridium folliculivorans TaxID=2886038 RepID=A0A9W6DAJ0_9CLOT|nr:hypothetical protein [Clostridium folliculivorans]GKU25274.1 hypothetical protein CFOLD11_21000 [Clostridium folliculivorans]GKU28295.1 hypothetical protein CFB3_04010 [Clostridium folliculivorans]
MEFFYEFLYCVVAAIASGIIFYIILSVLDESILQLFKPIKKVVSKLKRKALIRNISFLITIVLSVLIKDFFKLGVVGFGIIIGFFNSFTDVIFETGMAAPKKDKGFKIKKIEK